MNAAEIARALGGASREGKQWRARCPLHGGRSLLLCDGSTGRVLVTCFAGCDRGAVLGELKRLGLMDEVQTHARRAIIHLRRTTDGDRKCVTRGLALWHAAQPPLGTLVQDYLASRAIPLDELPAKARARLRFHSHCPHPSGGRFPAMLALVEHVERGAIAIHRTFLRDNGRGKADVEPDKASLGPVGGGAVHFGLPCEGAELAITEGIETGLAIALSCGLPTWAALSAPGIRALVLPREATHVIICGDHDANCVGQRAANEAAQRFLAEGRRVRIALPPQRDTDFADLLS
jgi:putative DNA primase/helicase